MVLLESHLESHGMTRSAFANRIGISKGYLSDILNNKRRPSLSLAARIDAATNGAVPIAAWAAQNEAEAVPQ